MSLEWPALPDDAEFSQICLKCGGPGPLHHVIVGNDQVRFDGYYCSGCYSRSMSPDDHALARLREAYPGWRIWHVPGNGRGTWCAQPLPLINVGSPDELILAIDAATPGSSEQESKALDPEGDMPVRAKGSQGF